MPLAALPTFDTDGHVQVVVESPRGSGLKLKYDEDRGVFGLSRPLISGLVYPFDWGFVPSTRGPDGDPVDAMIAWDQTSFPGLVLPCRIVALLQVEQNSKKDPQTRERNDRLIVVPVQAPRNETMRDMGDLLPRVRQELEAFFLASTVFEGKDLKILGWADGAAGLACVADARL